MVVIQGIKYLVHGALTTIVLKSKLVEHVLSCLKRHRYKCSDITCPFYGICQQFQHCIDKIMMNYIG